MFDEDGVRAHFAMLVARLKRRTFRPFGPISGHDLPTVSYRYSSTSGFRLSQIDLRASVVPFVVRNTKFNSIITMQRFSYVTFVAALAMTVMSLLPAPVVGVPGKISPHLMLNRGLLDSGMECSGDEWASIMKEVTDAEDKVDKNMNIKIDEEDDEEEEEDDRRRLNRNGQRRRELSRCGCLYCYFRSGCASSIGRRRLSSPQHLACDKKIMAVNNTLNSLKTTLTPKCRALVNAPRDIACRESVECAVDYLNLYNATGFKIQQERFPETGGRICASDMVTFEAVPTFDFGKIVFHIIPLASPKKMKKSSDDKAPYFMMGHNLKKLDGMNFEAGLTYTVSAFIEPNPGNGKNVTFTVDNC